MEPKRSREDERRRKREEADQRAEKNRRIDPLRKEVARLESRIAELEEGQKARSVLLADPATYEDASVRSRVLDEYRAAADELERLSDRWEIAAAELEEAEATVRQPR